MKIPTVAALLPAALGLLLAVVLGMTVPDARMYVAAAPALVCAVTGAAVTAVLLLYRGSRRRAESRLTVGIQDARITADQSRRRFVQRLDHELKNPLTALLTALSASNGESDPRDRVVAHAQADRIRRLLTDLRRVADVETVELDRAPVDIAALLHEAVDSVLADLGTARNVRVDVPSAPWPLPTVAGDADLLLVAVYNVVANAIKYTAGDDIIEVRAREAGDPGPSVVIEVADTGPGVAQDEQQLVWEELARGRAGAAVAGSGVGLALVRVIVQRHGGSVALRSRVGHGTSVYLQLPAA